MPLVVDASVAFKWFVPEPAADAALALLDGDDALWAPDLVLVELANALYTRLRSVPGGREAAVAALERAPRIYSYLGPTGRLVDLAVKLSFELTHPTYDCLYLALCLEQDLLLVTADDRFSEKVNSSIYQGRVIRL